MLASSNQRKTKSAQQSTRNGSASQSQPNVLNRMDVEERLFSSLDQNKELKAKNNQLQKDMKLLKARLRWPSHIQEAVLSKESQQVNSDVPLLETRNRQLMEKLQLYEQTIRQLEDRLDANEGFLEDRLRSSSTDRKFKKLSDGDFKSQEAELLGGNEKVAMFSQVTAMKQALEEWMDHAKSYKQQAGQAVTRLKETEERLAQMLRLHTLDSAELIRTSRTSKHALAQLTTVQEENHHYKNAIEGLQEKFGEAKKQLEEEKLRNIDLQHNAEQVQSLTRTNVELLQELDEVKKERLVVQSQLQNLVRDVTKVHETQEADANKTLQLQLDAMQKEYNAEVKKLHRALEDKSQEVADLVEQQEALKDQISKLRAIKSKQIQRNAELKTENRGTQTINTVVDLKPPEATVELSNEESDQMLSQMNDEVEQYKQMMRSVQGMCETYKTELAELHKQLQTERKNYAQQLSTEMSQFKVLQEQLKKSVGDNKIVTRADVETPPKPKPRKVSTKASIDEPKGKTIKAVVLEIESLILPKGSVLLDNSDLQRFFVDFKLSCPALSGKGNFETPVNYPMPPSHSTPVAIGHKHTWQMPEHANLMENEGCFIQFDLLAENEAAPDECTEMGVGKLSLTELMEMSTPSKSFDLSVPVCIEEQSNTIIAHLKVTLTL